MELIPFSVHCLLLFNNMTLATFFLLLHLLDIYHQAICNETKFKSLYKSQMSLEWNELHAICRRKSNHILTQQFHMSTSAMLDWFHLIWSWCFRMSWCWIKLCHSNERIHLNYHDQEMQLLVLSLLKAL